MLKHPYIGVQGQVMKSSKRKIDEEITEPSFLADPSHRVKVVAKHMFSIVNKSRAQRCRCTKEDALRLKKDWGYMIKNNREKPLNSWVRQVSFLLNTCLTIMKILLHSGASRHEHQKKEIHTIKQTTNSTANKMIISWTISWIRLLAVSNRKSSKRVTAYFWHKKNKSMNNIIAYVATKKNGP